MATQKEVEYEKQHARLQEMEELKNWIISTGLTRYSNDALDIVDHINKRILDLRTE